MLALSGMQDDGAPTPEKQQRQRGGSKGDDNDDDMVSIKQASLDEMMQEQQRLYKEIEKLKEENKSLFLDLGTAEDRCDELEDELRLLKEAD